MEQLTTEQALQIIDQAISQVQANREVHLKLQEAIQVLHNATAPTEDDLEPAPAE